MRRSLFFVVPALAAASFIVGCGADEKNKDVFSCSDVPIANGLQTICEAGGAFGSGKAPYACLPGSVVAIAAAADGTITQADCPAGTTPSTAGGNPDSTFLMPPDGTDENHDYPIGSDGSNAGPGGTNGTSDGSNASGGTNGTSTGSTTSGGTNGTSDGSNASGGTNGTSTGSTTSGSSSSSGGAPPGGGGGYQCANDGSSTTCVSTTCAAGHHVSSCGACVPDSCNSCACPSSGGALGCTYTQGYWKTHESAWPVAALSLGGKIYTKAEMLAILDTAPRGDASLILAHQLITTLLDIKNGASSAPIASVVSQAQSWLSANAGGKSLPFGVPSTSAAGAVAVSLASQLDAYNNGNAGVPHCN